MQGYELKAEEKEKTKSTLIYLSFMTHVTSVQRWNIISPPSTLVKCVELCLASSALV